MFEYCASVFWFSLTFCSKAKYIEKMSTPESVSKSGINQVEVIDSRRPGHSE